MLLVKTVSYGYPLLQGKLVIVVLQRVHCHSELVCVVVNMNEEKDNQQYLSYSLTLKVTYKETVLRLYQNFALHVSIAVLTLRR